MFFRFLCFFFVCACVFSPGSFVSRDVPTTATVSREVQSENNVRRVVRCEFSHSTGYNDNNDNVPYPAGASDPVCR